MPGGPIGHRQVRIGSESARSGAQQVRCAFEPSFMITQDRAADAREAVELGADIGFHDFLNHRRSPCDLSSQRPGQAMRRVFCPPRKKPPKGDL